MVLGLPAPHPQKKHSFYIGFPPKKKQKNNKPAHPPKKNGSETPFFGVFEFLGVPSTSVVFLFGGGRSL